MAKIKDIIQYLESIAPLAYQESYDNSGLLTGDATQTVTNVLITLDTTEAIVEEAIQKNCNLIISHHPVIFSGLKSLTGKNHVERTVIHATKNDIAIYAIHTNLDNISSGVNQKIADKIGLMNTRILKPKVDVLTKLIAFCPLESTESVLQALYKAGAGNIGNYSHCSFSSEGTGTFRPNDKANPHTGTKNQDEKVSEKRIEVIMPQHHTPAILAALQEAHPYEEVAYYLSPLHNAHQEVGAGMVGELPEAIDPRAFLPLLKEKMALSCIRHTDLGTRKIKKVAVCGGSGSFLLSDAIRQKADVFITADFKYHEFFHAEGEIIIADIGHYESEVYTKELIYEKLYEKFPRFALNLSESVTNPISYF